MRSWPSCAGPSFDLTGYDVAERLTSAVLAGLTSAAAGQLGFAPDLSISGAVDTQVRGGEHRSLLNVSREALLNVVSHAKATWARIEIALRDDALLLDVEDNASAPRKHQPVARAFG